MSVVRNKVVLVTGGAGFVGSALIRELLQDGAKVISYDNYLHGTPENFEGLEEFARAKQLSIIQGDVFDQPFLRRQISDHQVEFIINCIGDPFIPATYRHPARCHEVNAEGTLSVLEVVKECDIRRMIHISSCEVYGKNDAPALTEKDKLNPCSTYAESKCDAERYCREFLASFQQKGYVTPLVVARLFNCYGPRATHPYIIPEIIRKLNNSSTLRLGNLTERDFTYVHDTARAIIALLTAAFSSLHEDSPDQLEVINVGSGTSYSIGYLAQRLATIMGISDFSMLIEKGHQRPNDIPRFNCFNKKLYELTNWIPEVEIEEGLCKTVAWFKTHDRHWDLSRNDE